MADVTGPINTMPGSRHSFLEGQPCDEHPERFAVVRIQGETDSFGSEMHDMCQECYDEYKQHQEEECARRAVEPGYCEWGRHMALNIRQTRDYEEGSAGRLYDVCPDCLQKHRDELYRELEED